MVWVAVTPPPGTPAALGGGLASGLTVWARPSPLCQRTGVPAATVVVTGFDCAPSVQLMVTTLPPVLPPAPVLSPGEPEPEPPQAATKRIISPAARMPGLRQG